MLYETLNQPYLFLVFIITSLVSGLIFDIGNFIKFLCANKKPAIIIIDFIQTSLCLFLIFYVNLQYNYGNFRLFPYIIFIIFFTIERLTIGKLIAKFYLVCYNFIVKLKNKLIKRSKDETNKDS